MPKIIIVLTLSLGLAMSANAEVSGGDYAPITKQEIEAANQAVRRAAEAADRANPTPASPGWRAEQRGAFAEAAQLYRKACDSLRDAVSCHNLGYLYERGLGVPKDLYQAAALYERALTIDPANHFAKTRLAAVRPAPAQPPVKAPPVASESQTPATAQPTQTKTASIPIASRAQTQLLASAIAQDSKSWFSNRYDSGSLSDVSLVQNSGGIQTVRGNYSFNGGRNKGWASVNIQGGKVLCITYWDTYSCNAVRTATPVQTPYWQSEEQKERDRRAYEQRRREWQTCISRNDNMLTNAYNICGYNP